MCQNRHITAQTVDKVPIMSRSRRKTPICGITTIESDKWFKTSEHRKERAAIRIALAAGNDMPHHKMFGDPWLSGKDGKQYWNDPRCYRK